MGNGWILIKGSKRGRGKVGTSFCVLSMLCPERKTGKVPMECERLWESEKGVLTPSRFE